MKIITNLSYLRQKSKVLLPEEIKLLLPDIIKELEESLDPKRGIGLSAVQIGILYRVGIIRMGDKKINLVNPKILEKYDKFKMLKEGCLSMPGLRVDTKRYNSIIFENNGERYSTEGIEAICIFHEIDHMNGILIIDRKWKKRK